MTARVFVEDGEEAVGVELRLGSLLVGSLRIAERHINDARRQLSMWLEDFQLKSGVIELFHALNDQWKTLTSLRSGKYDRFDVWLGCSDHRRLSSPCYCAFH